MTYIDLIFSNGRRTGPLGLVISPDGVLSSGNFWTSLENAGTNAWYVQFGTGYTANNNKYTENVARPVAALDHEIMKGWVRAYEDCCRRKMTSLQCSLYRLDGEDDLPHLAEEVFSRTYEPTTSICFVVTKPVLREIFAADFRDRIVQHWICLRLNPLFEQRFQAMGDVTYNCRIGHGVLAAVDRIRDEIEDVSEFYTQPTWVAKIDIQACFNSIPKDILWKKLEWLISNQYNESDKDTLLWVTRKTLFHIPERDCIRQGRLHLWKYIAPGKSRFTLPPDKGMPIGNITSQLFCAYYLSFLDGFAVQLVRRFGGRYIRFVDDMTLIGRSKENLLETILLIRRFLKAELGLDLHPRKIYIQPAAKGLPVVGSVIKPGRTYSAKRTIHHTRAQLQKLENHCEKCFRLGLSARLAEDLEALVSGVNSYLGVLSHTASRNIILKLYSNLTYFWKICYLKNLKVVKIRKAYLYSKFITNKDHEENIHLSAYVAHNFPQSIKTKNCDSEYRRHQDRRRVRVQRNRPSTRQELL